MNRQLDSLESNTYQKAVRLFAAFTLLTGRELFIVRTLATYAEQDALFAQGRTEPGAIVTNAKAGRSWHNFGRAFDVALEEKQTQKPTWSTAGGDLELWRLLGVIAKWVGLDWGGNFESINDFGHFHNTDGMTIERARAQWETSNAR